MKHYLDTDPVELGRKLLTRGLSHLCLAVVHINTEVSLQHHLALEARNQTCQSNPTKARHHNQSGEAKTTRFCNKADCTLAR